MTRKFTEKEKNILYKDIPIQKQGYEVNWETYLFIILNIMFSVLIFKVLIFDYNPLLKDESFSLWMAILYVLIVIILVFIVPYLLTVFILNLIRDIIVYSRYGKYEEDVFETSEIEIFQGGEDEDFIIQIFNGTGEKIEIKIALNISVEYSVKEDFLKEIGNYRITVSEKKDVPLQDILKIFNAKIFTKKTGLTVKDYTTNVKLDSSEKIYYFRDFLKTKYNLVYAKKKNELLFVNFYGDDMATDIDIVVKDVESKIEYYYNEDRLL